MKNIQKICILISKPYKKINAQILNGIQKQALALGWSVVVFSINDRKEAEDIFHGECNLLNAINYQMFDGVIFVLESFSSPECIDLIIRQLKDKCCEKTVCIGEKSEDFDFECVSGNSRKSFQEITEHMIYVHNCRRICCLTGPKDNPASLERLEGYRDAMNAAGLNIGKNDVYFGDFWINSSEKYAEILLSEGLPDAVVCGNDIMAIYLCKYLLAAGVKIPDDVRVSGFDDTIEAAMNSPIISTYSVDFNAIGMRAVRVLLSKLTDIDLDIENDDGSRFAANESCGCYPKRKEYQQQVKGNAYIMDLEERYLDSSHQYWMLSSDNLQDYIRSLFELVGVRERNSDSVNLLKNDILIQLERINTSGQRPFGITLDFSDQTVNLAAVQSEISNKPEIQDRRRSRYYSALLSLRKMIYDEPARSWSMKYCAELLNLSTSYFQRLYEKTFGIKCSEDIQKSRLRYARKLLFETDLTLNEIAEKCGYAYQNFMRLFKRKYGVTPTEFRKGKKKI